MKELSKKIDSCIDKIQNFPKAGIHYKDITPIFLNPDLCTKIIKSFAEFSKGKIDVVCGIESRGFLFGTQIAKELNIPFVLIRKAGKLPPPVISQEYELEYGSAEIEIKKNHIKPNQRVLIHDDILATGGTAAACAQLVENCGAKASQFSFLISLDSLDGKKKLEKYTKEIQILLEYK